MKSRPISLITSVFSVESAIPFSRSYVSSVNGSRISIGCIPTPAKNPGYSDDSAIVRSDDSSVVPAEMTARTPTFSARSSISPISPSLYASR